MDAVGSPVCEFVHATIRAVATLRLHSRSKSGFGYAEAMTTSTGSSADGKPSCAAPAQVGRGDEMAVQLAGTDGTSRRPNPLTKAASLGKMQRRSAS
jgi:hypothetical protein